MAEKVGEIYYDVTLDTGGIIDGRRVIEREVQTIVNKINLITAAIKAYAVAQAALKSAQMADDMRLLATRVQIAAGSVDAGAEAMARLVEISKRTNSAVADNVQVFTRLNQSLIQMGGNQEDTLRVTELLGKAIKISGASTQEAQAAMLQFGQALGSGKLQGDEFRSLMENAPYLMRQMAAAIGVPVGQLKSLATQGKLTSDVVVNALTKAAASIDNDFSKIPTTVGGAFTVLADAAKRTNEQLDNFTGTSLAISGAAKGAAEVLDELTKQMLAAGDEAAKIDRNEAIKGWADKSKVALSYLADAADVTWQALSVLGRNVAFVFQGIGSEIGGIGAQAMAVLRGDFAGAREISDAMKQDAEARRRDLDAQDAQTLARTKTAGQKMREAWEEGSQQTSKSPAQPSKLKPTADPEEARKLAARRAAAQAYYDGIVAASKTAMEKINAEEAKELSENMHRMLADKNNADIYQKAKTAIVAKYARERSLLEEQYAEESAALQIELTTEPLAKIQAVRTEANRKADAEVRLGVKTYQQGEREKQLAAFQAQQQINALREQVTQTNSGTQIAATINELTKIDLARQESFRKADAEAKAGAITFAQAEADKARAAVDAQNAIRSQVLSINPLTQLTQEYQQKLAIVQYYETQMAQAGVDGSQFVEAKKIELARQYQLQRQQIAESEFASMSAGNQFVISSLNSLNQTATASITGLLNGTMSAADAMRNLGNVVLNEAVGALVQIGIQYLKNAVVGVAADKAMAASKAANAALYAGAVAAQVEVTASLAAASAFASTAAIPVVGPGLAPEAAAAAAAAVTALGAPAIAGAPLAGARLYGGAVSADSLYRVNESGAPEMYTAANGSQYMLPTKSGNVTPADQLGGTQGWNIVVNNYAAGTVATTSVDDQSRTVEIAVNTVASQIATNRGPVWSALRGSTNVSQRQ